MFQTFVLTGQYLFDMIPDEYAGGSSGFANLKRATLQDAARYTELVYGKNPMPEDVRYRVGGWDQDTRIPGDDWKADLYYTSAHLRQLIDREMGIPRYSGPLTLEQTQNVIARYNGSGPVAQKYANDAMAKLKNAELGKTPLYFYEKK